MRFSPRTIAFPPKRSPGWSRLSANTSCKEVAEELLRQCVAGERWDPNLALRLAAPECSDALFRIVFEGLADRFEPKLCDDYVAIFSLVLENVLTEFRASELIARYQRIREPRVCTNEPDRVVVLSRVTLGADIAVTSVILDAVLQRFPQARVTLAGSAKAAELFQQSDRIEHAEIPYKRNGPIAERLSAWRLIRQQFADERTIIVDPDSRLTQLGLLPTNDELRYFFFESRAYGGEGSANLTQLAQQWVRETFGVATAVNRIFPFCDTTQWSRYAAISLGTADNPAKQLSPAFESALMRLLCKRFDSVIVDRGFGSEESARVDHAIAGTKAQTWSGSFARFASVIGGAELYVGYDSAGQHAAASLGTPLITLFKGFVNERMFYRWQPSGPGPKRVIKVTNQTRESALLQQVAAALHSFSSSNAPESA
jgi:ADP-heptose:LPS heptosyltransferase